MGISVYDIDRYIYCLNEEERSLWEARPSYINAAIMKIQAKHVEQNIFQIDIPAEESCTGEVVEFIFSLVENKYRRRVMYRGNKGNYTLFRLY